MKNDTTSTETKIAEKERGECCHESGQGIALGIAFGAAIGAATDNVGLWIALGIVFGAAYDNRKHFSKKD